MIGPSRIQALGTICLTFGDTQSREPRQDAAQARDRDLNYDPAHSGHRPHTRCLPGPGYRNAACVRISALRPDGMHAPMAQVTERLGYSDQTVFARAILRIRRAICRRPGDERPSCMGLPGAVVLQYLQTVEAKPEDRKTEADRKGDQKATPFGLGSLSRHNLLATTVQKHCSTRLVGSVRKASQRGQCRRNGLALRVTCGINRASFFVRKV